MIKKLRKGLIKVGTECLERLERGLERLILETRKIKTSLYWENRYKTGGNSGLGSYGEMAEFKAEVVNRFVSDNRISSLLDMGCGDGHQLSLLEVPFYTGVDVSPTVVEICKQRYKEDISKDFFLYDEIDSLGKYDLVLSMDVIFHLLEDDTYEEYMTNLFKHARKYVIVYSSNNKGKVKGHMREHRFTDWVHNNRKEWRCIQKVRNRYPYNEKTGEGSLSNFYIYGKDAV